MAKFNLGQAVLLATLGAPVECTVIRVFPISRKTGRQVYGLRSKAGYTVAASEIELTAAPEPAPEFKFEIGEFALVNDKAAPRHRDSLVQVVARRVGPLSGRYLYRLRVVEGEQPLGPYLSFPESFLDVAA